MKKLLRKLGLAHTEKPRILPWYQDFALCNYLLSNMNFSVKIHPDATFSLDPQCVFFDQIAQALYNAVFQVYGGSTEGDIAEFGTFSGATAITLAGVMRRMELRIFGKTLDAGSGEPRARKLHLFDSFEGFPDTTSDIDAQNAHVKDGAWGSGNTEGVMPPRELLEKTGTFLPKERIAIYKGWFCDTLKQLPADAKFSIVHIDSDLYESARDILDDFFTHNRFANGCQILFDDWMCDQASPSSGEQRAWTEMIEKHHPRFMDLGPYGAMGHKFLIHAE